MPQTQNDTTFLIALDADLAEFLDLKVKETSTDSNSFLNTLIRDYAKTLS